MFDYKKILLRSVILFTPPLLFCYFYFNYVKHTFKREGNVFQELFLKSKNSSENTIDKVSNKNLEQDLQPKIEKFEDINKTLFSPFNIPLSTLDYKLAVTNNVSFKQDSKRIGTTMSIQVGTEPRNFKNDYVHNGDTRVVFDKNIKPQYVLNAEITNRFKFYPSGLYTSLDLYKEDANYFYFPTPTILSRSLLFLAFLAMWYGFLVLLDKWVKFITGKEIF